MSCLRDEPQPTLWYTFVVQLLALSMSLAVVGFPGAPENPDRAARLGAHLRVELLTMGPGAETYSRFGHSALRITDRRGVGDIVFNFGTFDHEDPAVISRFLAGTLRYWLSVSTFAETRKEYRSEGRKLIAQQLRLTPLQRRRLFTRLYALSKPDKRHYRYHHFRANCSTRIRDVLDEILGGSLQRQLSRRPAHTYRHWLRRATRGAPLFHLGFDLALTRADGRISAWEACFAPEQLMLAMDVARVGPPGREQSLVVGTRVLLRGQAFDAGAGLSPWTWVIVGAWLLLALAVVPLVLRPGSRGVWRLSGALLALWGLLGAALSALLIYVWGHSSLAVFTGNQNLWLLPPSLAGWLVVGGILGLRPPPRWRPPGWLVAVAAAQGLVALSYGGARLVGLAGQGNTPVLALAIPWSLAGLWILLRARQVAKADSRI